MNDPILAATTYRDRVTMEFVVHGGLHYMRGNHAPYFSLTYWAHRKGFPNQRQCGGAGHDTILQRFPQFADLAALHLCGPDGAPNLPNAWYWYAGAIGGAGERYHGGNDGNHSAEDCKRIFAETVRVDAATADRMVAETLDKAALLAWCEQQRPRWQAEAEACILHHGLVAYGDVHE